MDNTFCYKLFVLIGIHPDRTMNKVLVTINNFLTAFCYLLTMLRYFLDKNTDGLETSNGLLVDAVHYLALILGRKIVKKIFDSMKHFWTVDVTDDKVTRYIQYFKKVENVFKFVYIFATVRIAIRPFIYKGSSMLGCYVPPQIPLPLFYAVEYFYLIFVVAAYVSPNIFICFLIISLVVQFRLLNLKIKDLNLMEVENERDLHIYKRKLKFIIKHQQLLVRCVEDLNTLLSIPVALLLGISVTMMCTCMYLLTVHSESIADKDKSILNASALIIEFFLVYGLPAQFLMNEAESTADMLYFECKWYLPNLRPLREDFLFIMSRSQKSVCIRAANYHVINNRTVLLMLKTAYSLYTFLQQVA